MRVRTVRASRLGVATPSFFTIEQIDADLFITFKRQLVEDPGSPQQCHAAHQLGESLLQLLPVVV
jgi:hypothetical protein